MVRRLDHRLAKPDHALGHARQRSIGQRERGFLNGARAIAPIGDTKTALREVNVAGPTPELSLQRNRAYSRSRILRFLLVGVAAAGTVSCDIPLAEPPASGFLAVILTTFGPAALEPNQKYTVRIREASGTYDFDQQFLAGPNDTITGTYPLATYVISVDDVPPACTSRIGNAQAALISTAGNTAITRFNFECNSLLAVTILADGHQVDSSFVWTVTAQGGRQRFGTADAADTVRIDDITAGAYTVELGHIAENCIVTSDGWRRHTAVVSPPASTTVQFRVRCTDLERAPRVTHFASSIRNGTGGFYAEIVEPNRASEDGLGAFSLNITDCLGNPMFPSAKYVQNFIRYDRIAGADTARIAVTIPIPDDTTDFGRACMAARFDDLEGNTTLWLEERNRNETGSAPLITNFNAVLSGGMLRTALSATDPDNDVAGAYVFISFTDGSQTATPDGYPDIRAFNTVGYLPPFNDLPAIDPQGKFQMSDVIAVVVDVIDRAGNVTRATDNNFGS